MNVLERLRQRRDQTESDFIAPEKFSPLIDKLLNDLSKGFVGEMYNNGEFDDEEITGLLERSKFEAILSKRRTYYLVRLLVTHIPRSESNFLQVFELVDVKRDILRIFPRHKRFGALTPDAQYSQYDDLEGKYDFGSVRLYKLFKDASTAQFDPIATQQHFEKQLREPNNIYTYQWLGPKTET